MSVIQKPQIFENARIIDPSCGRDEHGSLVVSDGKIVDIGAKIHNQGTILGAKKYDLQGRTVIPGLVDARCFVGTADSLTEETLQTTTAAAAKGGITAIITIGEKHGTVYDNPAVICSMKKSRQHPDSIAIYPTAALTKAMQGQELTEYGLCQAAGAVALADGQETHRNAKILRHAFLYAQQYGLPVVMETQDPDFSSNCVATESLKANLMGLPAAPITAELLALQRDIALAHLTNVQYHAAHISTAQAIEPIKAGKTMGLNISAATSINSLSFNEQDIGAYCSAYRFFPPLRTEEDRRALIAALNTGTIDIITSCHQPRCKDAKNRPFTEAAAGAVGLESLLAAALRLYHNGEVPLLRLIEALSSRPAKLFGLPCGTLQKGAAADFVILDLDTPWLFDKMNLVSACKNTAFDKARLQGRIEATYKNGYCIYKHEAADF